MRNICIISSGYPTKNDPSYAFIRPLVMAWANIGIKCTIIAPQSITHSLIRKKNRRPVFWNDFTANGDVVSVYQPKFFSVSNLKVFGCCISEFFRLRAIKKVLNRINCHFDVYYAHFWDNGIIAATLSNENNVFVATGESHIWVKNKYSSEYIDSVLPKIKGVIAVSTKNLKESQENGLLNKCSETIILPNAFDSSIFYPMSQITCRKKLGLLEDDFIIAFVGAFSERKGVIRLIEAVKKIPCAKLVLIGSGRIKPCSNQIVFSGKVPHNEIPFYLNAADIFVLPTLAEGCCNAIVEAMACGLPIISSALPFNDDIIDDSCSKRIDPKSINEIGSAINELYEKSALRKKMAENAIKKVASLTIEKRAMQILNFMKICMGE